MSGQKDLKEILLQDFWERVLLGKINMHEEKIPQSPFLSGLWVLLWGFNAYICCYLGAGDEGDWGHSKHGKAEG